MKLNRIVEILLTEFDMMEGGDFETAIKLQNSALKIHTELEQEKNNVVKPDAIGRIGQSPCGDCDNFAEYSEGIKYCSVCGAKLT